MLLCFVLPGGDDFAAGERAYKEGRFADAAAAFAMELRARGDEAPAELCYDLALAQLTAGDLAAAEAAAERAGSRGGVAFAARAQFLRGNIAFARCLLAELQASAPEAEPFAFDVAIQHCRTALRCWQQAVVQSGEWPAAARNAERALGKLASLRDEQAAAALRRQDKKTGGKPQVHLVPQQQDAPTGATKVDEVEVAAKVQRQGLAPAEVEQLFARLQQQEQKKLQVRQQQRSSLQGLVERDW